jgi:hypothetical protein
MPAILNIDQCEYTSKNGVLTHSSPSLVVEGVYDWFTLTFLGTDLISGISSYSWTSYGPPIGSHTIQLNPGLDYITVEVTDCAIHVEACILSAGSIGPIPQPEEGESWDVFSATPDTQTINFWWNNDTQTLTYLYTEPGTYYVTLQSQGDPAEFKVYVFEITNNCFISDGSCKQYPLMIAWLNPVGGISTYVFNAKKTYNRDVGQSSTWKDANKITRYREIRDIYDGIVQPSGYIHPDVLDHLKSLKTSIAAWVVEGYGTEDETFIPIFNYAGSFVFKKQKNGFYEYNFDFSFAEEVTNQTA